MSYTLDARRARRKILSMLKIFRRPRRTTTCAQRTQRAQNLPITYSTFAQRVRQIFHTLLTRRLKR